MIEKTTRQKVIRGIRKWANNRKEEIFEMYGNKCIECKTSENLTIHHKQYIKGFEYVTLMCNKHHREFHEKEIKKRLLLMFVTKINQSDKTLLEDFKKDIINQIQSIRVECIRGIKIDGI